DYYCAIWYSSAVLF
nr:immunoglobulin light chain junction region [Macaca mulatta]